MTIPVSSATFNLEEDVTVDHTLYYFAAREGIGESPTVADSTFSSYEGQLLSGDDF